MGIVRSLINQQSEPFICTDLSELWLKLKTVAGEHSISNIARKVLLIISGDVTINWIVKEIVRQLAVTGETDIEEKMYICQIYKKRRQSRCWSKLSCWRGIERGKVT